jgi:cell division cycle 20-like protein 1 (cofactor of APC complex)
MDPHYIEKLRNSPKSPASLTTPHSTPVSIHHQQQYVQRNLFSSGSSMMNSTTTSPPIILSSPQSPPNHDENQVNEQQSINTISPSSTTANRNIMYRNQSPEVSQNSCRYIPDRNASDLAHGFHSPSPKKKSNSTNTLYSYSSPTQQTVKRVSPPIIISNMSLDGSLIRNGMRSGNRSRSSTPSPTAARGRRRMNQAVETSSSSDEIPTIDDETRGGSNNTSFTSDDRSSISSSEQPMFEMSRDEDTIAAEATDDDHHLRIAAEEEEVSDDEVSDQGDDDDYEEAFSVGIGGNSNSYDQLLRRELLPNQSPNGGIFRYEPTPVNTSTYNNAGMLPTSPLKSLLRSPKKLKTQCQRKICPTPYKILDAPGLLDDYYLNLVDWGATNHLAVALRDIVYLWNAATSKVTTLCELQQTNDQDATYVSSVGWAETGTQLAVGDDQGTVHLWDITTMKKIRVLTGHHQRVGCLAWNGLATLSSGSRDKYIIHHDIRSPHSHIAKLLSHKQEVCGLKWSPDGKELASGGNDNKLNVWQPTYANCAPIIQFDQHTAAVKALAWSPHQHGLLASGGGTNDRCIRFWNTVSQTPLNYVDTGSQVCSLAWSENANEIVSTHGFSQNQIYVWKYPTMTPLATLTGHSMRVLYLSVSPDGQNIVTGAGDETLRLWNVFPPAKSRGFSTSMSLDIR